MRRGIVVGIAVSALIGLYPAAAAAQVWRPAGPPAPGSTTMTSAFPDGSAFFAPANGDILRTRDGGATWQPIESAPPGGYAVWMQMATPSAGWAVRNGVLSRTTDGGATWSEVDYPYQGGNGGTATGVGTGADGKTVTLHADGSPTVQGCPLEDGVSELLTSHDGGATWRAFALPHDGSGWFVEWAPDGRRAVASVTGTRFTREPGECAVAEAANLGSDLWVTDDGGATWRRTLHSDLAWINAAWLPGGRLVAAMMSGEVHLSDDAGRTWRQTTDLMVDPGLSFSVSDLAATPAGAVYATVNGGGIMRSEDAVTWTKETSVFDVPSLSGFDSVAAFDEDRAVAGGAHPLSVRGAAVAR
jgi:photosystem II stability/assembly factor-like uncharacterized protein